MRIVLDAMGSDACPMPEIQAAAQAADIFGDPIILVGPAERLRPHIPESGMVQLIDAQDTLTMEDKGVKLALKARRPESKTTMAAGMDLVKRGEADAFVTAGNTGGALATAFYRLGVIPGAERPALTALFPVRTGYCVVLDIGANPEVRPEHILQFAKMGSVYARRVRKVENPRVGLISNGEEAGKGSDLIKNSYPLLESAGLNFFGNVEPKDLFAGSVDVAVVDGFTGNILLKTSEAVGKFVSDLLKENLLASTRTKIGAALAKPAFDALRKVMDPGEIGAAPLLGIDGLVFVGHGRSDARALVNAIGTARQAVESNLLGGIREAIEQELAGISSGGGQS